MITELLGWRWVMFVNVPVALAVLFLTLLAVPESRDAEAPRSLDVPGAAAATLGLALLIYAVSGVPKSGSTSPATLVFGGAGAFLLLCVAIVVLALPTILLGLPGAAREKPPPRYR